MTYADAALPEAFAAWHQHSSMAANAVLFRSTSVSLLSVIEAAYPSTASSHVRRLTMTSAAWPAHSSPTYPATYHACPLT